MHYIKQVAPIIIAAVLAITIVVGISLYSQSAQDGHHAAQNTGTKSTSNKPSPTPKKTATTPQPKAKKSYAYTAKSGDSYTLLARRAIHAYDTASHTHLSRAARIAAETFLTQRAGSPYLNLGQKVVIKTHSIQAAVKKASSLSKADLAAWATYVPYVNWS